MTHPSEDDNAVFFRMVATCHAKRDRRRIEFWSCRKPFGLLPTRIVATWTGPAHRLSWCHHRQDRTAVILTGRAISVPRAT